MVDEPTAFELLRHRGAEALADGDMEALSDLLNEVLEGEDPSFVERRQVMFADPEVARDFAEVAEQTEALMRRLVRRGDGWHAEAVEAHCAHLRAELGFDTAPPLVRLAIQRVIVTWLHSEAMYQRCAAIWFDKVRNTNANIAFLNREAARANAEFARATKNLAQIHKLLRPKARVQQLNVAMPGSQQANAIIEGDE